MICWARYLLILSVVGLGVISMVGACGRKGSLYLPKEEPTVANQSTPDETEVPAPPDAAPSPEPSRP